MTPARMSGLFDETPAARKRLALLLYAAAGPIFCMVFVLEAEASSRWSSAATVLALLLAGALTLAARPVVSMAGWIVSIAIVPAVCCGIAFVVAGAAAPAYLGLLGAPLAWAVIVVEAPVVWSALGAASVTCFVALSQRAGPATALAGTVVFSSVHGLVAWVIRNKAKALRDARQEIHRAAERDRALLAALPDTLVRADQEGRFIDIHTPAGDPLPLPREQLLGRKVYEFLAAPDQERFRAAIARTMETGAVERVVYSTDYPSGRRTFESRLVRSVPGELVVIRQEISDRLRAAEEHRLNTALVESMQEAVVTIGLDLKVASWSGGAERLYGWTAAEAIGASFFGLIRPECGPADGAAFVQRVIAEERCTERNERRRKDGTRLVAEATYVLLRDGAKRPAGILGVARDVTAAGREREQELDQARLRGLEQRINEVELVMASDGAILEANDRAVEVYGRTRQELLQLRVQDLRAPDTLPPIEAQFQRAVEEALRFETTHLRKDGARFPVEVSSRPFQVGGETYVHSLVRDLTALKAAEGALRESEALLQRLFQRVPIPLSVNNSLGEIVSLNDQFTAVLGYRHEDLPTVDEWFKKAYPDPAYRDQVGQTWSLALQDPTARDGEVPAMEFRVACKDGSRRTMLISGAPVGKDLLVALVDITDRKQAEDALRESELRLQQAIQEQAVILENASVAITRVRARRQVWASAQAERLFGYTASEMDGIETRVFYPSAEAWELVGREAYPLLAAGLIYQGEHQMRRKDGSHFWARMQGKAIDPADGGAGSIWCIEDVSQLRDLTSRAAQAERLAATATLVRGMAHEVNSPLASVVSNLFYAREQLVSAAAVTRPASPDGPPVPGEVEQALADAAESAARIRDIVSDLRSFALGDLPARPSATTLAQGIADARRVAGQDLARCRSVQVEVQEVSDLTLPHPDLIQVLSHLLVNAGQATGPKPNDVRIEGTIRDTGHVVLRVSDTGVGMSVANAARAFEPFFTTRDIGRGHGLGLSVCLGIVQAVGGEIRLASTVGVGTTVTLVLPRRSGERAEGGPDPSR
jgi:PAS domain S-box-containing protein